MSRVDIYHSRRDMFNFCPFWVRNEDGIGNSEEYVYNKAPSGYFYAKEVDAETVGSNVIYGAFMADQHHILIESADDLTDMTENSIVKYKNHLWRVKDLQKRLIVKESEFSSIETYYWYIQLVR